MSIEATVTDHMKAAMRAKDKARLTALRGIRAAIIEAKKEDGSESLSDDRALAILKRLAKQRRDSVQSYTDGGREDLAEVEAAELAVIEEFIPAGPSEEVVRGWVQEAISATGASSTRELGKVMGFVMKKHQGKADGSVVREIAQELLR